MKDITNETYLLVVNGKPEGPYTIAELKNRKINPKDFVRSAEMDDYKEAHEVTQLRELLGFSKEHVIPQYYASFDQRLLASFIDWFMIAGIWVIVVSSFLLFIPAKAMQMRIAFSLLAIIPLTNFFYHVIMESSARQATFGKQLLKIKVTDLNGERIGLGKSFGRNLAKIFSTFILFIGYLFSFFNYKHQCLHDMLADTLVIKERLI